MRSTFKGSKLIPVITAGVLLVAACGGGSKKDGTAAPDATDSTETTLVADESTTTTVAGETDTTGSVTPTSTGRSATTTKATTKATSSSKGSTATTSKPPPVASRTEVTAVSTTAPSEPPQPGGSVTVLMSGETKGYDPTLGTGTAAGGTDAQRMFAVYDKLVFGDPTSGAVFPQLAESLTTPDAVVWTMKIRPNVKFSDGTSFDAGAVKFNWDRHADPANNSPFSTTVKNMTYEVVDAQTLKITLKAASGQFPRVISDQLSSIGSPTAITAAGSQGAYAVKPVGAGPFLLKEWVRDSHSILIRNPNYWNSPRPYIDQLTFRTIINEQQRVNSFNAGEAQLMFTSNPTLVSQIKAPAKPVISPSINSIMFYMNQKRPPFNDAGVRKAIQLAVDIEQINKLVFDNGFETPKGYFPANSPFSDPSLVFPSPNLTQAQALIDAYVAKTGSDVNFSWTYSTSQPGSAEVAQVIQSQVQRLNKVKMTINAFASAQFAAVLVPANFDAASNAYIGIDPDSYWAEQLKSNGSRNYTGYANSETDALIEKERSTVDAATRVQAIKQIQKNAIADIPFFPLYRIPLAYGVAPNMRDVMTIDDGGIRTDLMWIKSH